jgi:predicted nucleic acid-binding protein
MKYLVDSNIIIYHLNGEQIATSFLKKYKDEIAISQITYVEVLSFNFTKEQENIVKELLEQFTILDIDSKVSKVAIKNRKTKKIKLPDNLIASTAMVYNLTLVTRNTKDFKSLSIDVVNLFDT